MAIVPLVDAQEPTQSEREEMYHRYLELESYIKGGSIEPHWMEDGSSFWYAEGAPENTIIWKVDSKANTKTPLFDTARLRKELTSLLGHAPPHQGLPFDTFTFVDEGEHTVKFTVEDKEFILRLDTYRMSRAPVLSEEEKSRLAPKPGEIRSPDGRWFASIKDHNVWLRSTSDGRSMQLTTDGVKDYSWGFRERPGVWSPDSRQFAARKVDWRRVNKRPIVRYLKTTVEVNWEPNMKVGRPMPQYKLFIIDVASKQQIRLDIGNETDHIIVIRGWRPDASELLFFRVNREFNRLDLMAASPGSSATRVLLIETQKTFILKAFWEPWPWNLTLLEGGKKFIWMAERDGWRHLYLYDISGNLIRRLTEGPYPVVRVITVDDKTGWVYFTAHGNQQRPYDTHLYRVNLSGKGFARLIEATGQHEVQFSPSKEFFLDTHSSVNRPPSVELRTADGALLRILSTAKFDALMELQWKAPEEFVVKAADGKTDLYGVLYKPYDFVPSKRYPVVEVIYGGPWVSQRVRSTFIPLGWGQTALELAQLGFITFVVDGRGTPERGKEFQDVVYGNVGRYEIPDHTAALKQLGEKRPYMDLNRVGVFGHSFGGYLAQRALLLSPDVYHVAVSSDGNVGPANLGFADSQPYLGLPQKNRERYDYASNLWLVGNLRGKLLFINGTFGGLLPRGQIKMWNALMRADKPFDLLVVPDRPHSMLNVPRWNYWRRAMGRYFQEHLNPKTEK
jgi:dipeptidyl aminopeptidase/acylaminoacyl peptidase